MWMKRITIIFGISMAAILALTTLLSAVAPNQPRVVPTAAPVATFPPPPAPESIVFAQRFLHPAGLYTVAVPAGWGVDEAENTLSGLRTVLANEAAQSVIQVDVDRPPRSSDSGPLTLDVLDARYNNAWLASSWREYRDWEESERRRSADDRLIIDFALQHGGQTFVARQQSWTDGEWIYAVRVVTPENATAALLQLLEGTADSLRPLKELADTPFLWNAWFDGERAHFIRYPQDWTLSDSAPGRPTSLSGGDASLRIESLEGQVADEAAAGASVSARHSGAEVLSVAALAPEGAEGFAVAWRGRNVDGDSHSGFDVLLNGADGQLHVASLRFPGLTDLNSEEGAAAEPDLEMMMRSFRLLPDLAAELAG
ncbi:MAG: hypothetical protein OXF32_03820 [Anaerolineaceae bacterium]|nr:hypothetical protein [Anaerolineaceae bacterium]